MFFTQRTILPDVNIVFLSICKELFRIICKGTFDIIFYIVAFLHSNVVNVTG